MADVTIITTGLAKITNYKARQKIWMAASGDMEDIGGVKGAANSAHATCYKKLYTSITRVFFLVVPEFCIFKPHSGVVSFDAKKT